MPRQRRCCIINCKASKTSLHQIPSEETRRNIWLNLIKPVLSAEINPEYYFICGAHFEDECFQPDRISRVLKPDALPTKFNTTAAVSFNEIPHESEDFDIPTSSDAIPNHNSCSVQTDEVKCRQCRSLQYELQKIKQKYKRLTQRYVDTLEKLDTTKKSIEKDSWLVQAINKIKNDANMDVPAAVFLTDQLINYDKKRPSWSELSIRQCIVWRFASPKGYEVVRNSLIRLPSKTTLKRYMPNTEDSTSLIKTRLLAEAKNLNSVEKLCSLIIDDMAVKEKIIYSKVEDKIYGLDNVHGTETMGEKPAVANKMLCFVIHGISTKYTIPTGYFFHKTLPLKTFYNLTMDILKLVTECGFTVLRITTDNHKSNVGLFRMFGNGQLRNSVNHPFSKGIPLFFSFDYCHAVKNARNLFLDHDLSSPEGEISSDFLRKIYEMQKTWPVKAVAFLTKKHLYPSNFDKMNVLRAVQIFAPQVTAALKYLFLNSIQGFEKCEATVIYMENIYKFFQVHDVSNRVHHLRSLNTNVAPYSNVSDERLDWLHHEFPTYIKSIEGLTQETSEALVFTAESTHQCVKYLLSQKGFFYVLTRTFSSDAIEATFSHIRMRCGSNDTTDVRAAEYAIKQILKCGIIKSSSSANVTSSNESTYISAVPFAKECPRRKKKEVHFSEEIQQKCEALRILTCNGTENLETASVAFLAGYLLKRIQEFTQCSNCIGPLKSEASCGPLLGLIYLQSHGNLHYPSWEFTVTVEKITSLAAELLHLFPPTNLLLKLFSHLRPFILHNPIFSCPIPQHNEILCDFILPKLLQPIIINFCRDHSDKIRHKALRGKPLCRKVLKVN